MFSEGDVSQAVADDSEQKPVEASTDMDDAFSLTSTPSEVHDQFVREVIDRTIGKQPRKQPHQCVTVKLPYTDYARVTRVREKWELNQTDLIRFFFEMALPILEAPSDDFRPILEAHRDEVRSQREEEARKRGRVGMRNS